MSNLIYIIAVGACLWATVDMIQSPNTGIKKALWIAAFWFFAPVALPFYFLIARKRTQAKPKFGSSAWGSIIGLMFAGPLGAIAGAYLGHSALRMYTMGDRALHEAATPDDLAQMGAAVQEALRAGAIGYCDSWKP